MKGIIYYTDNRLRDPLKSLVQKYIQEAELPIVSSSLRPIKFGLNEVIDSPRGYPTMVKQIISCLERSAAKYVFFCEHDVLYHKSHFDFTPERDDIFYYNSNVWRWYLGSERAIQHDRMIPLSSLCVNRDFALEHYRLRDKIITENGWTQDSRDPKWVRRMGYEPGTKKKRRGGVTDDDFNLWNSEFPIIDVRHGDTFTPTKMKITDFKHEPKWWKDVPVNYIDGWNLSEMFNI